MSTTWVDELAQLRVDCQRRHRGLLDEAHIWPSTVGVASGVALAALALTSIAPTLSDVSSLLESETDRAVRAAIARAAPHLDIDVLAEFDATQLAGLRVLVRGATGEIATIDALLRGELPLPPGAAEVSLADFGQVGHDIEFASISGAPTRLANVKIASSPAVLREHFATHPDVPIVYASTDAIPPAGDGIPVVRPGGSFPPDWAGEPIIVDIDVSSDGLDDIVIDALLEAREHASVEFDDLLLDLTVVVFTMTVGRALWQWASTDAPSGEIADRLKRELIDGLTSRGAGMAVGLLTGVPLLRSATSMTVSISRRTLRTARTRVLTSEERVGACRDVLGSLRRSKRTASAAG